MGIRGDLESPFWNKYGQEEAHRIVAYVIDELMDPNLWLRMKRELEWSDEQVSHYFDAISWIEENVLTKQ